jgi:hypothetical protein
VEDVKPVFLGEKRNGFQPATILRRIFTRINDEKGRLHPV